MQYKKFQLMEFIPGEAFDVDSDIAREFVEKGPKLLKDMEYEKLRSLQKNLLEELK